MEHTTLGKGSWGPAVALDPRWRLELGATCPSWLPSASLSGPWAWKAQASLPPWGFGCPSLAPRGTPRSGPRLSCPCVLVSSSGKVSCPGARRGTPTCEVSRRPGRSQRAPRALGRWGRAARLRATPACQGDSGTAMCAEGWRGPQSGPQAWGSREQKGHSLPPGRGPMAPGGSLSLLCALIPFTPVWGVAELDVRMAEAQGC